MDLSTQLLVAFLYQIVAKGRVRVDLGDDKMILRGGSEGQVRGKVWSQLLRHRRGSY